MISYQTCEHTGSHLLYTFAFNLCTYKNAFVLQQKRFWSGSTRNLPKGPLRGNQPAYVKTSADWVYRDFQYSVHLWYSVSYKARWPKTAR